MFNNVEHHYNPDDSTPPNCCNSPSGDASEDSSRIPSRQFDFLRQPWSSVPPEEPFEASPPSQLHNAQDVGFFGDFPTDQLYTYAVDAFWEEYDEATRNGIQSGDTMNSAPTSIDPSSLSWDQGRLESDPPNYRKYMVEKEGWVECSCPLGCARRYSGASEWKRRHEPLDLTCPMPGCGLKFSRKDVMKVHQNNPKLHLEQDCKA